MLTATVADKEYVTMLVQTQIVSNHRTKAKTFSYYLQYIETLQFSFPTV